MSKVLKWNSNIPYRCPNCNTIHYTSKIGALYPKWFVAICCNCLTKFTRFPWLSFFLPHKICLSGSCPGKQNVFG